MTGGQRCGGWAFARSWGVGFLAAVWLGTSAWAALAAGGDRPLYSPPKHGTDRFVHVRGHDVHYVEAGEGRPILLIPGAFTTYRAWNRVLAGLSPHGRVLAVDYVGVGDSAKPESGFAYSVEEQADALAEMLAALHLTDVTVVGASYGGAMALNLAVRYPDIVGRAICIEGGALITPEALNYSALAGLLDWPVLGDIIWGFMQSGLFDEATARSVMGAAWDRLSPEERREIVSVVSANIRTSTRAAWLGIYRAITRRIDFMDALGDLRVRVLYLYGADSKYRAVAEMNVRRFERHAAIDVVEFPGGIHDLHLQYPDAVAGMILHFLAMTPGTDLTADAGTPRHAGVSRALFD